jgi:hypothetical protein
MTVTQDGSGDLTVTMTETPCGDGIGPCTYNGTGTLDLTSNNFTLSVATTEDTLVDYYGTLLVYPLNMSYSGTLETGCNLAETTNITDNFSSSCVGWLEGYGYSADDAAALCAQYVDDGAYDVTKPCDLPTGETTAGVGWNATEWGAGAWNQTLQPTSFNFGGRNVTEQDPGGGGPDSCWFSGSSYDPFISIGAPPSFDPSYTWLVTPDNVWGTDWVGYIAAAITYYQADPLESLPCSTSFPQQMVIDCSDSPTTRTYVTNTLGAEIDADTVYSYRNDQYQSRSDP